MLALILVAIKRRRAQALLLVLLGMLTATAAAAAPNYIAASNEQLAYYGAQQAAPSQQLVRSQTSIDKGSGRANDVARQIDQVKKAIVLPDFQVVTDLRVPAAIRGTVLAISTRDGICDQIIVDGDCDLGADRTVLDSSLAQALGVKAGDKLPIIVDGSGQTVELTVAGTYTVKDPQSVYWTPYKADSAVSYVARDTLLDPRFEQATATLLVDQVATPAAFRRTDPQLLAQAFERGARSLAAAGVSTTSDLRTLADRIWSDQQFVLAGVAVGACHLLLLAWLALFLAVRHSAHARRSDVALLKMRGGRRRDLWLLVAGQSALPVAAGGLIGLPLGVVVARLMAGPVESDALRQQVLLGTAAAAGVAVLGGILAGVIAERRMLNESVAELARGVPGRRRIWGARILDAVCVTVAAVAVYVTVSTAPGTPATGGAQTSSVAGIGLIAPILVGLAAGVLLARLVPALAQAVAVPTLRAGRLTTGLATMHLARRRTMSGAVAMTVLAIAVLCATAVAWDTAGQARADRAAADVGADRVLLVTSGSRGSLLSAVRQADPSGRYAMAAVELGGLQPLLAVDSTRLAAVAADAPFFDQSWAEIAQLLHPAEPATPVAVDGTALTIDATWTAATPSQLLATGDDDPGQPPSTVDETALEGVIGYATAELLGEDGAVHAVRFGPLTTGRHSYSATVAGCAVGCRLVDIGVRTDAAATFPPVGAQMVVHGLTQAGPDRAVLTTEDLVDRTGWRTAFTSNRQQPLLTRTADGLAITNGPDTIVDGYPFLEAAAYRLDAPTPLPIVLAGSLGIQKSIGDTRADAFGYSMPVSVVRTARSLPRLDTVGVLMDLSYVDRLTSDGRVVGTSEVWLSADAPDSIVDALTSAGLRVYGTESLAERFELLEGQGPAIVLRFLLLAALAGAALALATFIVVMTVERPARAQELGALRQQGMAEKVVWRVGLGSYLALSLVATVIAVGTAWLMRPLLVRVFPTFSDSWTALEPPDWRGLALWSPALAVVAAQVVIAVLAGRLLVRAVRRRSPG